MGENFYANFDRFTQLAAFHMESAAQDANPGRALFENRCARCHGGDGAGGERGPNILNRLAARNDQQLGTLIREGIPGTGMPASQVTPAELTTLTGFLRSIQPRGPGRPVVRMTVKTIDGKTLDGQVLGQGFDDLQLRTNDQRIHLLRRAGDRYREVTSEKGWPSYNGELGGNRYTTMDQITLKNVSRLAPKWVFTVPTAARSPAGDAGGGGRNHVCRGNQRVLRARRRHGTTDLALSASPRANDGRRGGGG